jgi:hypothetical protein
MTDRKTEKPARPWTVWSTQIVAFVVFAGAAVVLSIGIRNTVRFADNNVQAALKALGLFVTVAAMYLTVLIGLALRSFFGRLLGIAGLLLLVGGEIFFLTMIIISKRGLENAMVYYGPGAVFLFLIVTIPFFTFLAYRLALGKREKAFFARPDTGHTEPPPPPSFETGPGV